MTTFCSARYSKALYLLTFILLTLIWEPRFTLSIQSLHLNMNFDSEIAIFGDAKIVDGGSSVQLTRPTSASSGLLLRTKPFRFFESNPSRPKSFSTDFTFSISPHSGDGLALVIVPTDFPSKFPGKDSFGLSRENRFLGIEFDTSVDGNVGVENANHVGVDVCSVASVRVSNVSSTDLVLNSGVKLQSWIDYDSSLKRLEVRVAKQGDARPYGALLAHHIDLSNMWKEEEVVVGLSSSTGNSVQTTSVYSWDFRVRSVPKWMHSHPVNPQLYNNQLGEEVTPRKKGVCLGFISGLVLAVGCGALAAFLVILLLTAYRDSAIPSEQSVQPVNFRYEKIKVDVENSWEDVKK